ncbi:MAG: ATP-binding cassette domain-containing protein [Gemmataceae bacterium]
MSMIQVDRLTKLFGPVLAVDDISFTVNEGEIVGFLGPNGAGKTTTMRILTTYLTATSGTARVAGFDVLSESMQVRQKIGFLPESVPLYPEMRVDEYLLFRGQLRGIARKARVERVDYCLDRCRLKQVRRRLLGTLSKGYRQRVGLADTMLHEPKILILDEPTSGLDPYQIRETLALIKELGGKHTILLSTHILTEVETVCERAIIINAGRVNYSESLDTLEGQAVILLDARGPVEALTQTVEGVSGVSQVKVLSKQDGLVSLEVRTQDNADQREAVGQAVTARGWPVRRLERKRRKLEDAYFDVLRAQDPLKETGIQAAPAGIAK